jgi:hypothetical protein
MTYEDTNNVISSPESVVGPTPCGKLALPTTGKSGLEVAHARRLAWQDKAKDLQIPATCGRSGWS